MMGKKMTKKELIAALSELAGERGDAELDHLEADRLLIEYINDEQVADAFEAIQRWYA